MIMKAAENGKHIFVEKPLTLSLEESKEVMKNRRNGRHLPGRFYEAV